MTFFNIQKWRHESHEKSSNVISPLAPWRPLPRLAFNPDTFSRISLTAKEKHGPVRKYAAEISPYKLSVSLLRKSKEIKIKSANKEINKEIPICGIRS